jgi:hypothetical protein
MSAMKLVMVPSIHKANSLLCVFAGAACVGREHRAGGVHAARAAGGGSVPAVCANARVCAAGPGAAASPRHHTGPARRSARHHAHEAHTRLHTINIQLAGKSTMHPELRCSQ